MSVLGFAAPLIRVRKEAPVSKNGDVNASLNSY